MGKKHPYYAKSMSINFPDFPYTMGFVAFFRTVRNLWGNPYISHMLKYTIGWELDEKKAPILREKYDYRFPRIFPYHGFCCIFPYCGKFMGNPCISHIKTSVNFSCDDAVPCLISCLAFLFGYSLSHYFHSAASSIIVLKGVSK